MGVVYKTQDHVTMPRWRDIAANCCVAAHSQVLEKTDQFATTVTGTPYYM